MADKSTSYNDNAVITDDNLQTSTISDGTEPATSHDVKEGGLLGVVGGAVVGLLAGGPIGAVIGAVAGGAASAAAVSVVDKHDHDYDQTVSAASDGAYSATDNAVPLTEASAPAVPTAYSTNLAQKAADVDPAQETVIPIVEESLQVGKRQVQSGGAHIHTGVIETPVEEIVNLREEHVSVTRHAADEPVLNTATAFKEQTFEVTETKEVPVIAKQARVVEEIVIGKTATNRIETVHDTVRRTEVEVDELGVDGSAGR